MAVLLDETLVKPGPYVTNNVGSKMCLLMEKKCLTRTGWRETHLG